MGLPYGSACCPVCGGALKKAPERKTRCPHCGDYLYVRVRPDGETLLVGSHEASEIEAAWQRKQQAERYIRDASYGHNRAEALLRVMREECPPDLVMFYVRFAGPLRHGAAFDARECHDKKLYTRVVDLDRRVIVAREDWSGPDPARAPEELLIRPLISGSTVRVASGADGFTKQTNVEIPDDWHRPWTLEGERSAG